MTSLSIPSTSIANVAAPAVCNSSFDFPTAASIFCGYQFTPRTTLKSFQATGSVNLVFRKKTEVASSEILLIAAVILGTKDCSGFLWPSPRTIANTGALDRNLSHLIIVQQFIVGIHNDYISSPGWTCPQPTSSREFWALESKTGATDKRGVSGFLRLVPCRDRSAAARLHSSAEFRGNTFRRLRHGPEWFRLTQKAI
eukprot:scaffold42338_cov160-Amphora_coffeaeformis.AAC.3